MIREFLRLEHVSDYNIITDTLGLNNIFLNIYQNEIVGVLCGYHNATSDIARTICGFQSANKFRLFLNENLITNWNRRVAFQQGIRYINALDNILSNQDIAFNIFFNDPPSNFFIHKKENYTLFQQLMTEMKLPYAPDTKMSIMDNSDKFILLLLREYVHGARLIVIDNLCSAFSTFTLKKIQPIISKLAHHNLSFLICDDDPSVLCTLTNRIFTIRNSCVLSIDKTTDIDPSILTAKASGSLHSPFEFSKAVNYTEPSTLFDIVDVSQSPKNLVATIYAGTFSAIIVNSYTSVSDFENLFYSKTTSPLVLSFNTEAPVIGVVPEQFSFYNNFTIYENITLSLEKEFSSYLGFINKRQVKSAYRDRIPDFLKKEVNIISQYDPHLQKWANQKLIEICRQLVKNPDVLIFFNPFYRLSSISSGYLFEHIKKIHQAGYTIIFILNDYLLDKENFFDQVIHYSK